MEKILVRGYEYSTTKGMLHVMYEVSKSTDNKLHDVDYVTIINHFNIDNKEEMVWEDEVIELLLDSEDYKFTRVKDGFIIYRY